MNTKKTGAKYEAMAVKYLQKAGYRILEQNFRCRQGEIDIIARHEQYLVFVEVKYRSRAAQGSAAAAVSVKKQQTISRVAAFYLCRKGLPENTPCRFDVAAIDGEQIQVYQNAFEYQT